MDGLLLHLTFIIRKDKKDEIENAKDNKIQHITQPIHLLFGRKRIQKATSILHKMWDIPPLYS